MLTKEKIKQIQKVANWKKCRNTAEGFFGMLWRLESLIDRSKQNHLQWVDFYLHPSQKQLVKNAYTKVNFIQNSVSKNFESIAGIKIHFTSEVPYNNGIMINSNIPLSKRSVIICLFQ